MPTGYT